LQEDVSEAQTGKMAQADEQLLVPQPLLAKFAARIRPDLVVIARASSVIPGR
jgi:hypothetical protein